MRKVAGVPWAKLLIATVACIAVCVTIVGGYARTAEAASSPGENNDGLAYGQLTQFGKSHLVQDASWYAAKVARRDKRVGTAVAPDNIANGTGAKAVMRPMGLPTSYTLYYGVTANTWEPLGSGTDSAGHAYTDGYYWNFCGEGATTVTLGYWGPSINGWGQASYSDPHTTTTWNDTNNRSYLMWLATDVEPPSFGSPGEVAFGTYPSANTYTTDLRDTLNWVASDDGTYGTWSTYYYAITWASSLSQSALMADIQGDIGGDFVPVVVDVNTAYLPSWSGTGKSLSHYVAIVGYNTTTNILTYIDTCGTACGSDGNGVYTVSLSSLYGGIENNNGNGSITW